MWREKRSVHPVTDDEFRRVKFDVEAALRPHGYVYYDERGLDFLTKHNWFCDDTELDRTLRVEVRLFERQPNLQLAIGDVQRVLQRHLLWRVLFEAWGPSTENVFVYPDTVRLAQLSPGRSLEAAIEENLRQRQEWIQRQPSHLQQRLVQLRTGLRKAIRSLRQSKERAMVACWFDTITHACGPHEGCFRSEGLPGTSIWIVRKLLDDDYWPKVMSSSLDVQECYWANSSGQILFDRDIMSALKDSAKWLRDYYQVIHFYSVGKRRSLVKVNFDGNRYRFTVPCTE